MKKALLFVAIALLGGFALGTLFGSGISSAAQAMARGLSPRQALLTAAPVLSAAALPAASDSAAPEEAEPDTNLLLERARAAVDALAEADYFALSQQVHPEKGVTLTPYSTVSDCDRVLLPQEVAALPGDEEVYTWGLEDGVGDPIRLTGTEYFARYVYNADYAQAPEQALNQVLMQGNALENVAAAYPEGRFVEYHFPGLDEALEGFDWCSLKLVFEPWQGDWRLVGIIHSEWTI